ncbi:unnamed protein product, partial [marine sediment metagenome]
MEKSYDWTDFTKDCEETKFFDLILENEGYKFMFHRCLLNKYSYFNNILSGEYQKVMNKNGIHIIKIAEDCEVIAYFLNYVYYNYKLAAK